MENTTNMVPVIKQEGTVLTDRSVDILMSGSQDLADAYREIGKLQGKLDVAELKLHNLNAEKAEHITVKVERDTTRIWDNYKGWISNPAEVQWITMPNTDIDKIADVAVKAQALKDVEKATKNAEEAEAKAKRAGELLKSAQEKADKEVAKAKEEQKQKIEEAVRREQRQDKSKIADLELQVKALNHENDLMLDERNNIIAERNLALEVKEKQIKLLEDRINVLSTTTDGLLNKIKDVTNSWNFIRRIKRIN